MKRRTFIQCGLGFALAGPLMAAVRDEAMDAAEKVLADAVAEGMVHAAVRYVCQGKRVFSKSFHLHSQTFGIGKMKTLIRAALTIVSIFLFSLGSVNAVAKDRPLHLLRSSRRIVFLGDSLTYAGQYVAYFDAWLLSQESAKAASINLPLMNLLLLCRTKCIRLTKEVEGSCPN